MATAKKKTTPRAAPKTVVKKVVIKKVTQKKVVRAAKPRVPTERLGLIEVGGKPATVLGDDIKAGQKAPEFSVQANDWSWVQGLASTEGKVRILASVPSLSTNTCDKETRTFNERAAELGEDVRVMVISTDLPPTQKVWCAAAGIERVQTYSDHMDLDFGTRYGTAIKERRWHRRAVFVVDKNGVVTYVAYMPVLGIEPNYDEVLAAARAAI
jgi:thioredoxin-dependent peroxiredoxin